ncbi:MAG TPA: hypothetical protein VMS64_23675 [Candidatus Methylomirabilis sp.]|nr:hypothetical protein [Candidatus Methylomirabilis sp.]
MKAIKIAELKNLLSYYLRRVRLGESILVTDRDRVIAKIARVSARDHPLVDTEAKWQKRLESKSAIRRGVGPR